MLKRPSSSALSIGLWATLAVVCAARTGPAAAPGLIVGLKAQSVAADRDGSRRSLRDGVYSDAQADRGRKTFDAYCASCHQPQAFVGPYLKAWTGRTVDGLFETVRNGMPEENPGGLERQEYTDILAFIFRQDGAPSGPEELPSSALGLKQVVIEVAETPANAGPATSDAPRF